MFRKCRFNIEDLTSMANQTRTLLSWSVQINLHRCHRRTGDNHKACRPDVMNRGRVRRKLYLTVILLGLAGYGLIYITNEAVGRVGYYQLISGKSEKNNCFSKFSSNSLDFFGWNLLKSWHFLYRPRREKIFSGLQNISTRNSPSVFLLWSNLTTTVHIMGLGNQSESWKVIILS